MTPAFVEEFDPVAVSVTWTVTVTDPRSSGKEDPDDSGFDDDDVLAGPPDPVRSGKAIIPSPPFDENIIFRVKKSAFVLAPQKYFMNPFSYLLTVVGKNGPLPQILSRPDAIVTRPQLARYR